MRYRLVFITGLAVGYVLGARAGRERYEQLRKSAQEIIQNPAVRNTVESAAQTSRSAASKAAGVVGAKVGDRLPDALADHVRALRDHRTTARGDDWGTTSN
jgi:hypothetical protein